MLEGPSADYFAVDPGWHHLHAARIELEVASASKLDQSGVFVVYPAVNLGGRRAVRSWRNRRWASRRPGRPCNAAVKRHE